MATDRAGHIAASLWKSSGPWRTDLSGAPDWFLSGLRAVALAPSALGKQPVRFTLLEDGKTVLAQPLEGVQADICLGIARYHFEVGSGHTDIVVR